VQSLRDGNAILDAGIVKFFMMVCGGNFGIFMSAMEWLRLCQKDIRHRYVWDTIKSTEEARELPATGFDEGLLSFLAQSRAVRGCGDCNTVGFLQILFGGPKAKKTIGRKAELELTIGGFQSPEGKNHCDEEFVRYDWDDPDSVLGVSNSILADFYAEKF
jgi:hypothetical protein